MPSKNKEINNAVSISSARRAAHQMVDMSDPSRKRALNGFPSEMRCMIVEEMVNIRLQRLRDDETNTIRPPQGEESRR